MKDLATQYEDAPFPRVFVGVPEMEDDGFEMWLRISEDQRIRIPHRFIVGLRQGQPVRITVEPVDPKHSIQRGHR